MIKMFMKHRVAANLLMALMLILGISSLFRMNVQFLPNFNLDVITVSIDWPGASAKEVENSLLIPLEKELRSVEQLKKMSGTAIQGNMSISLEFHEGSDMSQALDKVREYVGRVRNTPQNSEKPIITRVEPYETVAELLLYGPNELSELKHLSYQFERELLDAGIGKIQITGLPQSEIAINVKPQTLARYKLSLPQIAQLIQQNNQDIPAGKIGKSDFSEHIKIQQKKISVLEIERIPLLTQKDGQLITVGDIATVTHDTEDAGVKLFHHFMPAVKLRLLRAQKDNTLNSAKLINQWYQQKTQQLNSSIKLVLFNQSWQLIKQRIDTLIYNGISGLLLIVILLFLVLNRSISLWITLGIPTSIFASLWILSLWGGTINMVSLFAFILTIGIIVDDAIVIGEQTLTNMDHYDTIETAVLNSCHKMLPAIISSSLTTISAFFPLLFVSGVIGTVLFDIPLVVICVIVASLIECFFVLPGHLYYALSNQKKHNASRNPRLTEKFISFRDTYYPQFIKTCIKHRFFVLMMTSSLALLTLASILSGVVKFTFFPTPDSSIIKAQIEFLPGTPEIKRQGFLNYLGDSAVKTAQKLRIAHKTQKIIVTQYSMLNQSDINDLKKNTGENYGSHVIELINSDERDFDNYSFIRNWRKNITLPDFVARIAITSPRGGPPGKDIDIQLNGDSIAHLKEALSMIANQLRIIPGVSGVSDNLPYQQQHWVFKLNPYGERLGLTTESIGQQVRAAFNGEIVQLFYTPHEEIEIEVKLDKLSRNNLNTLYHLPIITPKGTSIPLDAIVDFEHQLSPEAILHTNGKLTANITAEVDHHIANSNQILAQLSQGVFKTISSKFSINLKLRGKSEEQEETLSDIKTGLVLALMLIYIILAWVFNSYSQPLIVMIAIPLGLIGAIFGHWIMGINLTLLSLFGLFGLSGIVINDSIILLNEYNLMRKQGLSINQSVSRASTQRLRAVLLTSITTITGLTPLLFERSLQAQFLIPMATSITFGLAFATILILIVIPSLLYFLESMKLTLKNKKRTL